MSLNVEEASTLLYLCVLCVCLWFPFTVLRYSDIAQSEWAEILGFPKGGIATLGNSDFYRILCRGTELSPTSLVTDREC